MATKAFKNHWRCFDEAELKERFRTVLRYYRFSVSIPVKNFDNKLESFNCWLTVHKSQPKVSTKSATSQQKLRKVR